MDYHLTIHLGGKITLTFDFTIIVQPTDAVGWHLLTTEEFGEGIMSGEALDLQKKIVGVVLEDSFGNIVSISDSCDPPTLIATFLRPDSTQRENAVGGGEEEDEEGDEDDTAVQGDYFDEEGFGMDARAAGSASSSSSHPSSGKKRGRSPGGLNLLQHLSLSPVRKRVNKGTATGAAVSASRSVDAFLTLPLVQGRVNLTGVRRGGDREDDADSSRVLGFVLDPTACLHSIPRQVWFSVQDESDSGLNGCTKATSITAGLPRKIVISAPSMSVTEKLSMHSITVNQYQRIPDLVFHLLDGSGNEIADISKIPGLKKAIFQVVKPDGSSLAKVKVSKGSPTLLTCALQFNFKGDEVDNGDNSSLCSQVYHFVNLQCVGSYTVNSMSVELEAAVLNCRIGSVHVVEALELQCLAADGRSIDSITCEECMPMVRVKVRTDDEFPFCPGADSFSLKLTRKPLIPGEGGSAAAVGGGGGGRGAGAPKAVDADDFFYPKREINVENCIEWAPLTRDDYLLRHAQQAEVGGGSDSLSDDVVLPVGLYNFHISYTEQRSIVNSIPERNKKVGHN